MTQQFTTIELENIRTFLARLSPAGWEDQQILIGLVSKIDNQIAKGKAHGNRRHNQSRTAA